ncbi:MAG: hypothetical protein AAGF15_11520 [Pseudomonadota bacterium]
MKQPLRRVTQLALADLKHDALSTTCQVLLIMAVLAPLLILFALKYGIVSTLTDQLRRDPETLRLKPRGSYALSMADIEQMRARPETRFAMPMTRSIAAHIDLYPEGANINRTEGIGAQMLPTGAGDPLAYPIDASEKIKAEASLAPDPDSISLAASVARKLGLKAGDRVLGVIERNRGGRVFAGTRTFAIHAIVDETKHRQATAFVHLDFLSAAERYRDDYAVPQFGWDGTRDYKPITAFRSFRLYARRLEDVARLASYIRSLGYEVKTEAPRIASVLGLSRNLGAIFWMLGTLGAIGLVGALAAASIASIERKRRAVAVLNLLGFERRWLVAFPLVQNMMIAGAGVLLSFVVYGLMNVSINGYFSTALEEGTKAASLEASHFLLAMTFTLAAALIPAMITARRTAKIDATEALREL